MWDRSAVFDPRFDVRQPHRCDPSCYNQTRSSQLHFSLEFLISLSSRRYQGSSMCTNFSRNLYIETRLLSLVRRKEQTIGLGKARITHFVMFLFLLFFSFFFLFLFSLTKIVRSVSFVTHKYRSFFVCEIYSQLLGARTQGYDKRALFSLPFVIIIHAFRSRRNDQVRERIVRVKRTAALSLVASRFERFLLETKSNLSLIHI